MSAFALYWFARTHLELRKQSCTLLQVGGRRLKGPFEVVICLQQRIGGHGSARRVVWARVVRVRTETRQPNKNLNSTVMEALDVEQLKKGEVNLGVRITANKIFIAHVAHRHPSWQSNSRGVLWSGPIVGQLWAATSFVAR